VFSPWLITYQQIFDPVPLKIMGVLLPVWPFYLLVYALLGLLFTVWAKNALDSRKMERNIWARVFGLLLINSYLWIGLLCMKSYYPIRQQNLEDFYVFIFCTVLATLAFFTMGGFTDRDRLRYEKRPLFETFHPARLFLNDSVTGIAYLILLLISVSVSFWWISKMPANLIVENMLGLLFWIVPWLLIFTAMRLAGFRQRAFFVAYLLGTVLYIILVLFERSGKPAPSGLEYFSWTFGTLGLWILSILYHAFARFRFRQKKKLAA
jgi:hypothetical protein